MSFEGVVIFYVSLGFEVILKYREVNREPSLGGEVIF